MEKDLLKYFTVIGKLQSTIAKSDTLDEALQSGLKLILDTCKADYCLIWYKNNKDNKLHPYYWICPKDFTESEYEVKEGIVGKVFESQKAIRLLNYQ